MTAPIEMMLEGVTWVPAKEMREPGMDNLPFVTHEGELNLFGTKMRCYRLSSGQTVFNADDMEALFASLDGDARD